MQTLLLTAVFHFVAKQRKKVKSEIDISSLTFLEVVMKKVTKLVYGLSACLLLTLVGCNNETEDVTPKAVAEKVAVASVSVPAEVTEGILNEEMTVVTADNKEEIETELKEALKSEDLSGIFNQQDNSEIVESSRSIAYEDLASLGEEYAQKMSEFTEALEKNGSASMTFSKTPGQVTGLKEGMDLSIPLIFMDMKIASTGSQMKSTMTQSSVIAVGANVGFDFTKFEEFEDFFFKNIKTGIAINSSNVINVTTDLSGFNPENFDSNYNPEDLESMMNATKYSGYVKGESSYSLGGVFVTKNKVAGKILFSADVNINVNDISKLMEFDDEDISENLDVMSEFITVKFEAKVYDFEGKEICTLISSDNIEELSEFMDIEDLLVSVPNQGF